MKHIYNTKSLFNRYKSIMIKYDIFNHFIVINLKSNSLYRDKKHRKTQHSYTLAQTSRNPYIQSSFFYKIY